MKKFSAEMFESLVSSFRSGTYQGAKENRTKPRVGVTSSIDIVVNSRGNEDDTVTMWMRDISDEGIGLVSPKHLPADSKFLARFRQLESNWLDVKYEVVYCEILAPDLYSIGGRLLRVLVFHDDSPGEKEDVEDLN